MAIQNTTQREQLEDAFQVFNQVSGELVDSYHQLQKQVTRLTSELSASRSQRLQELAEKESLANRLSGLLETLPAAVVVLDGEGLISQFNPAALELLPGIALGDAWQALYQGSFRAGQQGHEQWLESGRLVSITRRSLGSESGAIVLLLEMTGTRQLQERIARRQRLSVMGEMSAQLAHQIRTPLSSALLYTSHLSRDDLSAAQRERFSQRCLERLHHMESQVNDMLAFARGGQFESAPIILSELFDELLESLETPCLAHHATLETDFTIAADATIHGNQAALLGALNNLAINAFQQDGAIRLRIEANSDRQHLLIRFQDNGPGIPESEQERIFDPFFTTRPDGTGLGLAVVQSVVLGHQGKMTVSNRSAGGACFSIQLPLLATEPRRHSTPVAMRQGHNNKSAVRSSA